MFAFHLFNTVTNHTAVATILLNLHNWKIRIPTPDPSQPQTWLCSFLRAYTAITMDSRLNKSCTSNLGYQDYQKRHKQTGCTKNSAEAFFIQLIPVRFPVPLMFLLNPPNPQKRLSTGRSSPGRHLGLQVSSQLL